MAPLFMLCFWFSSFFKNLVTCFSHFWFIDNDEMSYNQSYICDPGSIYSIFNYLMDTVINHIPIFIKTNVWYIPARPPVASYWMLIAWCLSNVFRQHFSRAYFECTLLSCKQLCIWILFVFKSFCGSRNLMCDYKGINWLHMMLMSSNKKYKLIT